MSSLNTFTPNNSDAPGALDSPARSNSFSGNVRPSALALRIYNIYALNYASNLFFFDIRGIPYIFQIRTNRIFENDHANPAAVPIRMT